MKNIFIKIFIFIVTFSLSYSLVLLSLIHINKQSKYINNEILRVETVTASDYLYNSNITTISAQLLQNENREEESHRERRREPERTERAPREPAIREENRLRLGGSIRGR